MRCIYLSLINYELDDGYNRKTLGQIAALKNFGWDLHIICYRNNSIACGIFENGIISWLFQSKKFSNIVIRRIFLFLYAASYIVKNPNNLVYIRYPRADFLFALFLLYIRLRIPSAKLISEIPTYPFKFELPKIYKLKSVIIRLNELLFRPIVNLATSAYSVVAYADNAFGVRSIRIENGVDEIDFDELLYSHPEKSIEMVFVANFSANNYRHGLDRLLEGLRLYCNNKNNHQLVRLNIVGDVTCRDKIFEPYQKVLGNNLLVFHGRKSFDELKALYRKMHLGVGCLGFHRISVTHTSALKEREYLSFGMPIISSSADFSFDEKFPYRLALPSDDSVIDINKVVSFVDGCYRQESPRLNIRNAAIAAASWANSMAQIKIFVEGK